MRPLSNRQIWMALIVLVVALGTIATGGWAVSVFGQTATKTLTVTTTSDPASCPDSSGLSLRCAIVQANSDGAQGYSDTIGFNIVPAQDPGCPRQVCTITVSSPLPWLTGNNVTIVGTNQDGSSPDVYVDGGTPAASFDGLHVAGQGDIISHISFGDFQVALDITGADATVQDGGAVSSTIGVRVDTSAGLTLTDDGLNGNVQWPLYYSQIPTTLSHVSGLGIENNGNDAIRIPGGSVPSGTTPNVWSNTGTIHTANRYGQPIPLYLDGLIGVPNGAELDIEAGTYIAFGGPYAIQVNGGGTFNVNGSAGDLATFTAADHSVPWQNITFEDGSSGSINYADVQYAGANWYGSSEGIHIRSSAVTISNTTVEQSVADGGDGSGIQIENHALPTLTGDNLQNNAGYGLYYNDAPSSLDMVTGLTLSGNGHGTAIRLGRDGLTGTTGVWSNPCSGCSLALPQGLSLNADSGATASNPSPKLTIAPNTAISSVGDTITVNGGTELDMGQGTQVSFAGPRAVRVYGTFNVNGAAGNLATFTAADHSIPWQNITFEDGSSGTVGYADVQYAGANWYGSSEGIHIRKADVTVSNTMVEHTVADGGDGSGIEIENSGSPTLSSDSLQNNAGWAVYLTDVPGSLSKFSHLSASGNGVNGQSNGIRVPGGSIPSTGSPVWWFSPGTADSNPMPLHLAGMITVPGNTELDISGQTTVEFGGAYALRVYGTLNVNGTLDAPTTFTAADHTVPWQNITFEDGSSGTVRYADLQYAGADWFGSHEAIYIRNAAVTVGYNSVENSAGNDIQVQNGGNPVIQCNDFSALPPSGYYAVLNNGGAGTIDAQRNWWGSADGANPPGHGSPISAGVDANNWLTTTPANDPTDCPPTRSGVVVDTPSPTATSTVAPTETVIPTDVPTDVPTNTSTATETPVPATDTPQATATDTPVPPTDIPTDTPVPSTDTPTATNTPVPTDTPTDTPAATATDTPTASATDVVTSGPVSSFRVSPSVASIQAGSEFSVTVAALDADGQVVQGYSGTIQLSSTDMAATLPSTYTFAPADYGTHTFSHVTLRAAGTQSIVATDGTRSFTSSPVAVSAAPLAQLVLAAPGTAVAGTPISITVRATDAYGNTVSTYGGSVHFSSGDDAAILPADASLRSGAGSFSVTFKTAGAQTLTVADTTNTNLVASATPAISVSPGLANSFVLQDVPLQVAGDQPFTSRMTVKDAYNNVVTNYSGAIQFSSTDSGAVLPSDFTLDNGVGSFTATLKTSGSQRITLTDMVQPSLTVTTPSILVDTTAPVIAPSTGTYQSGTWTNQSVPVVWDVNDGETGISAKTGCDATALSSETAGTTLTCAAANGVGLSTSSSLTVRIDKTRPTLTGVPTTTANSAGWYRGDVSIVWSCGDLQLSSGEAGSGINGSCPANSTISGEGSGLTGSATVGDNAGNITTAASSPVNIDRTPPLTTATAPGGWNNTSVTVNLGATDNLSGVAATYYNLDNAGRQTYDGGKGVAVSGEGAHTLTYWSVDAAGNTETARSVQIKIDLTAPNITDTLLPLPNAAGWNNAPVTVTFTCTDALSGIKSCDGQAYTTAPATTTGDTVLSTEGLGQILTGTAVDSAGNSASATASVSIDSTRPTISGKASPAANSNGWNNTPVTVSFSCSDPRNGNGTYGSGISSCSDATTLTEGANQSVSGTAQDAAGNTQGVTVSGINIDTTQPTIVASAATQDGRVYSGAWTNQTVTVSFTCSDPQGSAGAPASGLATGACPAAQQVSGAANGDGPHVVTGTVTDRAGNKAAATFQVNIDTHGPTVTAAVSPAPNQYLWNTSSPVTVSFTCSDQYSGVAVCPSPVSVSNDVYGQQVSGTARDAAGNSGTGYTYVYLDTVPPSITYSSAVTVNSAGTTLAPYTPGAWTNQSVKAVFTCTDATSHPSSPSITTTLTGEGANQTAQATCTDKAGWSTSGSKTGIFIDKTPPTLTTQVSKTVSSYVPNTVLLGDTPALTASATDALSGAKTPTCTPSTLPATMVSSINGGDNSQASCTATDNAGNSVTRQVLYTVIYNIPCTHTTNCATTKSGLTTLTLQLQNVKGQNVGSSNVGITASRLYDSTTGTLLDLNAATANNPSFTYKSPNYSLSFVGLTAKHLYTLTFHSGSDYDYQVQFKA